MPTITGRNPTYKHRTADDREDTIVLVGKLSRIGLSQKEIALAVFKEKEINLSIQCIGNYQRIVRQRYKEAMIESRGEQIAEMIENIRDVRTEAWLRFHSTGDNEYLTTVMKTVEQECKLRGLIEPDKKTFNTMIGVNTAEGNFSWDVLIQEAANRNNVLEVQSQPVVFEGSTEQQALPSSNGDGH